MNEKIWKEFTRWGSGFKLEAERDYDMKNKKFIYHLTCYGLFMDEEELISMDINQLMQQAIKKAKKNWNRANHNQPKREE